MNLLDFAFNSLYCRPARSILTMAAIALAVAAIVSLTGIAWGFEASWQKANDARGTDLIVTKLASENAMPSPFVSSAVQQTLQALPHVKQVVGLLSEMLSVSEDGPPIFVFGWAHNSYLWDHLRLTSGEWPKSDTSSEAMIGSLASEILRKTTGDSIEVEGRKFVISGTFESDAMVENGAVLMTLSSMQQVTDKPGKVNVLNLKMDSNSSDADKALLKVRVRVDLPGFVAITSGELVQQNALVRISKAMSHATILIACLVGALVVFNTMLMSVKERTREIGVLLALGWQQRTVMTLICFESVMLTACGACFGILLGIALTWGLEHVSLLQGKIDAIFSFSFLAMALGFSVLMGVVGGIYPAFKASRLHPAQALREE